MKLIVQVTQVRKAKGLTQADLAQLANVSRKTINTIENNVFVPSTILALTLAKVLDVSVHDLFKLPDTSDL
jgi:putative transcriptional regulator